MTLSDTATAVLPEKKRTNGHANPLHVPLALRLAYAVTSRLSTRLAGELARRIFFWPPRSQCFDKQRAVLSRSDRVYTDIMNRRVVLYLWGSGPVVLLVHGWGGHAGQMTEFVAPLTKAGYRVIAFDAPAHGRSKGRLSSATHIAKTMHAVENTFGPVHGVIAHSLGTAATVHALRSGFGTQRVVFLAPLMSFEGYWRQFRQSLRMRDADWRTMTDISERWLKLRFADVHPGLHAERMSTPLLVLHGSKDRACPITEGQKLARLWPGATFQRLTAGHLSILRDWRAILASTDFMGSDAQQENTINRLRPEAET